MRALSVTAPDGVKLAAGEWGNPTGPEIIFIHGFSQSSLCWLRQLTDNTLSAFRMVAYDLRGHGASDKPLEKEKYAHDQQWADDLAAVIETPSMHRPVLVGWSYAGRVISDFLKIHGPER